MNKIQFIYSWNFAVYYANIAVCVRGGVFSELFDCHRFIGYLLVWCGVVFIVSNVRQIGTVNKSKVK